MATLRLSEVHIKPMVFATTTVFICLAALAMSPIAIVHGISFPIGLLCLASLWLTPWEISIALFFSALGDLAGSSGVFLAQMGFFAVAHLSYILFFIRRIRRKKTKMTDKMKGFLLMLGICILSLLALVLVKVVPATPPGIVRIGVCIYTVLVSTMLMTALMQRSLLYALGALLFVVSDFTLAWNMFVEQIPNAGLILLSTYFAGQWLIFIRATPYRIAHPIHLMRF